MCDSTIGWVVNALNSTWGNSHELETVARVNNRSYHGYWFLLPGFFQAFADFVAETGGVTIAPDAVRGRSAVLSYVGDQAVIDICPDTSD